jgi:hypothetical protein
MVCIPGCGIWDIRMRKIEEIICKRKEKQSSENPSEF